MEAGRANDEFHLFLYVFYKTLNSHRCHAVGHARDDARGDRGHTRRYKEPEATRQALGHARDRATGIPNPAPE